MPFPAMPTQITCPSCNNRFMAQVHSIVDVGEQPELKEELLRGRLNVVRCPQCGGGGLLSTPMIYHDPEKELLVALVPSELGLSADEQEQLVGSLVNVVMNNTPAEQRKSYFFQPQTVLRREGLIEAILEADGISREVIEAQRQALQLITDLVDAVDDEEHLDQLVEEHRDDLDYEFFLLLSEVVDSYETAQSSGEEGDADEADVQEELARLKRMREALLERVNLAGPAAPSASYDDLVELLADAGEGEKWQRAVAMNRPRLDYGFFQRLTARIEAAEGSDDEEVQRLTTLRQRILTELDEQNARVQRAQDRASLLVMRLLEADDVAAAVRENRDKVDEILIGVLTRYHAAAREEEDEERAAKLEAILDAVVEMLEEQLPPADRLINRLLRADYPEGTNALLEQHRGLLDRDLLKMVDETLEQLGDREDDLAERLRQIRGQIEAKITILRA